MKLDPTPLLAASSCPSPITTCLYSGLHHVSFCVLILLTGVDRGEVWNVRRGRNKQCNRILLIHVVAFPKPSVVKSHCTIFLLLQPWAPRLPCMVQQWEEDLVLYNTQLFVLRFQLNIILLHSHAPTFTVIMWDLKYFYRSTWSPVGYNNSCGRTHDCRAESTHATCRQAPFWNTG
jgi:hypothetical protein